MLSYQEALNGSIAFHGMEGERLVFHHSNMGEPYREGVEIRVEGVDSFPDYQGPFVESSEVRRIRDFLTSRYQRSTMKAQ